MLLGLGVLPSRAASGARRGYYGPTELVRQAVHGWRIQSRRIRL